MKDYFSFIILALIISSSSIVAQESSARTLHVENASGKRKFEYNVGSYISLQTYQNRKYYGRLNRVLESAIVVSIDTIPIKKVKKVFIREKGNGIQLVSKLLLVGGVGYFAISSANRIINEVNPIIDPSIAAISAPMIGLGILIKWIFTPTIRIKNSAQLNIAMDNSYK